MRLTSTSYPRSVQPPYSWSQFTPFRASGHAG